MSALLALPCTTQYIIITVDIFISVISKLIFILRWGNNKGYVYLYMLDIRYKLCVLNHFKGCVGETSERKGGAHMAFPSA